MNEKPSSSAGATIGWMIGLMALAGWAEREGGAMIAAAAAGFAIAQALNLKGALAQMRERLRALEAQLEQRPATPVPRPAPVHASAPVSPHGTEVPVRAAPPVVASPLPRPSPPIVTATPRATAPTTPAAPPCEVPPSPFDLWLRDALGWFTRGNPLARAGIVVLFFGGAFLAKYAADHSHFPAEARFIGIAAAAMALLVLGWRLRDSRAVYAQTLQGGGVAGLYLTVFAATKLYQLLPPMFALGLMVVVAVTSAIIAVAQNALALAVIGTAGGFMAPILVSTGSSNHIALFTYYAVLNLGIFTVAWFRAWRVLNLLGFVFTFGIAGAFRGLSYTDDKLYSTDFFVWLYFLMYVGVAVLFSLRQKADLKGYVSSSLVFGTPLAAFALHTSLVHQIEYALAWSALGLGVFYVVLGWLLLRTRSPNLSLLTEAFAALGVIFASMAVPLAFDAQVTASTWAVEGAGLLWLGVRQQRRLARAFGVLLQLLGGAGFLVTLHRVVEHVPVFNSACIGAAMLAIAGLLSGRWLERNRPQRASYEEGWDSVAALWASLWWLSGGLAEIHLWWPQDWPGLSLLYLAASAVLAQVLSARWQWRLPSHLALALMPLGAALGLTAAAQAHHPLLELTWAGWPALLAVHYWLLWKRENLAPENMQSLGWPHSGGVWMIALLLAWEARWRIAQEMSGVWPHLPWGLVAATLLWLLSRDTLRPAWPLQRHAAVYRVLAAGGFALVAMIWIVAINLASDGTAEPLPYLPLLNPLDVSVALALVSLATWWLSLPVAQRAEIMPGNPGTLMRAAALLVFYWLNAALLRALHHLAGTPLSAEGMAHSTLVQTALSIFWGLLGFAAMVLAARRQQRDIWITGAGLMAVVVAKLFLVDLAGSGTLARIVSFLVVGALLLITGYLSPLPPRKLESAA